MQVSPAALAAATPEAESSRASASAGATPSRSQARRYRSGAGLACGDVVGGHDRVEDVEHAGRAQRGVDQAARRVRGEPQRHPPAQPRHQLHRPGPPLDVPQQGGVHHLDHLVDELRAALARLAQPLREEVRGVLERGADHPHLVLVAEDGAVRGEELLLGALPEHLGVEQQAVHVEDDGPIPMPQRLAHPLAREEGARCARPGSGGAAPPDTGRRAPRRAARRASAPPASARSALPTPAARRGSWRRGASPCRSPRGRPRPRRPPRPPR